MTPPARYCLVLEDAAGDAATLAHRLRRLLKSMLRAHGLRCVKIEEVTEETDHVPTTAPLAGGPDRQ